MKKLMALVLALVMTLGLATVGSNAAYNDESKISLNEAVDVMSAVGVFKGSYGNFDPNGNLTREQAAKLIAYLDLGEKAAEALPALQVFDDVDASRWSAKYVAYCQDAGYVGGVGNNKYDPAGNLTGYAFGKMILCVLGYDAHIEGLTGASWTINVAKLMEKNDINDGVSAAPSENLTREQGAQYCLNALKADMVEYENKGTSIEINGATIATGASKASKVANTLAKDYRGELNGDLVMQLCEKLYKTDLKFSTTGDDFKAPANKWTYKNSEVGTYADSADATYTGKVTMATIYNLLGKDIVSDLAAQNKAQLYFINDGLYAQGYAQNQQNKWEFTYDDQNNDAQNVGQAYPITKNSTAAAFESGKGTVTEVYIKDDGVAVNVGTQEAPVYEYYAKVTVVTKHVFLMKALSDYNAKTEKLSVEVLTGPFNEGNLEADDFAIADYKEDDYILYTYADGEIQSIQKAQLVSGKVTTYTKSDSLTLDGTKYSYNVAAYTADDPNTNEVEIDEHDKNIEFTIGETATVVLDAQGNIVYIDEAKATSDDIVFVVNAAKNGFDVQAKIVNVDGTKRTVTVDTDDSEDGFSKANTDNVNWAFTDVTDDKPARAWAYEIDGSEYEMSNYANQQFIAGGDLALNKKPGAVAGKTANSKTVYIVEENDGDITLYTGVKNAPDFTAAAFAIATFNSSNEIEYMYIKCNANTVIDDASSTDELVYVLKVDSKKVIDSDKNEYAAVEALVNGEKTSLKVKYDKKDQLEAYKLYKKLAVNGDGFITSATAVALDDDAEKLHDGDYDFIKVGGYEPFGYSDGVFTAKGAQLANTADVGDYKEFIKTDKVYVVVKGSDANSDHGLLKDAAASYELTETTFSGLKTFVRGYTVDAEVYTTLNSDGELTSAYVVITSSHEGQQQQVQPQPQPQQP